MKTIYTILCSLLFASFASAGAVSVAAKPDSEKKPGDKTKPDVTRAYWLNVRVSNSTATKLDGVTLKWALYSATIKRGADTISVEKSGEMKISVDANGRYVDVATPKVAFTMIPYHTVRKGRSSQVVEASGKKYHGFHVQILNGTEVIGEAVSESVKKELK
ncbi:MAG: hypothetical protein JST76_15395 [Bacteroidetes bacterium]|nr:hypothetical protein [Bacteroidota bacterium]